MFVAFFVFVVAEVVYTVIDELKFKVVKAKPVFGFDFKDTFVVEKECEATLCSKRTSMFIEIRSNVSHGAGIVVGGSFNENSNAVWAVSFVGYFFVIAGIFVGGLFDGAFNGVFRHVCGLCVLHKSAKTRVGIGIRSACFGCDGNFFAYAGESSRHVAPAF